MLIDNIHQHILHYTAAAIQICLPILMDVLPSVNADDATASEAVKTQAKKWLDQEIEDFIDFLYNCCSEASSPGNFKPVVWMAAKLHLDTKHPHPVGTIAAIQKIWEGSCYSLLKKTDPTAVLDKYLKLIMNLLRKHASILTQLRTGHAPLAKHLYCIGKIDSPTCPACQQNNKMVEHLLLHCKVHQPARQILQNSITSISKSCSQHQRHYKCSSTSEQLPTAFMIPLEKYQHCPKKS